MYMDEYGSRIWCKFCTWMNVNYKSYGFLYLIAWLIVNFGWIVSVVHIGFRCMWIYVWTGSIYILDTGYWHETKKQAKIFLWTDKLMTNNFRHNLVFLQLPTFVHHKFHRKFYFTTEFSIKYSLFIFENQFYFLLFLKLNLQKLWPKNLKW